MPVLTKIGEIALKLWRDLCEKLNGQYCGDYSSISELKELYTLFQDNTNIAPLFAKAVRFLDELLRTGNYLPQRETNCMRAIYDAIELIVILDLSRGAKLCTGTRHTR